MCYNKLDKKTYKNYSKAHYNFKLKIYKKLIIQTFVKLSNNEIYKEGKYIEPLTDYSKYNNKNKNKKYKIIMPKN